MHTYEIIKQQLMRSPKMWLITGVAGFIGSNLLETLLKLDQYVVGLDNFSTGQKDNLDEVLSSFNAEQGSRFKFIEGDIRDLQTCERAVEGVDYVLHQAAIGSVPRSIKNPVKSNENNVTGFLNILVAARDNDVKKFVYASSSSVYGDQSDLPMMEDRIGNPLSPYAVTKYTNELYAEVFWRNYDLRVIGLRYFNVFGQRQDPQGEYAAVIPRWFSTLLKGKQPYIFGDGKTTRDFCFVENAVQANILSACVEDEEVSGQVFNIAFSEQTSLHELYYLIRELAAKAKPRAELIEPEYRDFRPGDVRHSLANINKARKMLGYNPAYSLKDGLIKAAGWYTKNLG